MGRNPLFSAPAPPLAGNTAGVHGNAPAVMRIMQRESEALPCEMPQGSRPLSVILPIASKC